ncbi:hypothetical protein HR060_13535 [Catenovulum sp. SM1970]|uniref:hypothetical protein n=1 Tax=Marinifaba aquimaris TaxID=2741323 RepID=UPI001574A33E|nr:hypothetical protein [Marinifaba aquimaris]NTS77876.1 hypothetical protein [Marinifaba aquimaris]
MKKNTVLLALTFLITTSCATAKHSPSKPEQTKAQASYKYFSYLLGEVSYLNNLYPPVDEARFYLPKQDMAHVIAHYTTSSLKRDGVIGYNSSATVSTVKKDGKDYYQVAFSVNSQYTDQLAQAAQYGDVHRKWMSDTLANQAYVGVNACKESTLKATGKACWDPDNTGEWELFLPLGLPMLNQKASMLIHYPPYVSIGQGDYLDNNTLARWERLLRSNGVANNDTVLFENIIDIIPIGAPGSGQSQNLPASMAETYFDNAQTGGNYVTPMLAFNLSPQSLVGDHTIPLVVFGTEAREFFAASYLGRPDPKDKLGILEAGSVSIGGASKQTPFLGANHPIAAVYQHCAAEGDDEHPIITMEKQDLISACYIKEMAKPDADTADKVLKACKKEWLSPDVNSAQAELICINAKIDLSSFGACSWENAVRWCKANNNDACKADTKQTSCQL